MKCKHNTSKNVIVGLTHSRNWSDSLQRQSIVRWLGVECLHITRLTVCEIPTRSRAQNTAGARKMRGFDRYLAFADRLPLANDSIKDARIMSQLSDWWHNRGSDWAGPWLPCPGLRPPRTSRLWCGDSWVVSGTSSARSDSLIIGRRVIFWITLSKINTGEVDKSMRCRCKIFWSFNVTKITKIG